MHVFYTPRDPFECAGMTSVSAMIRHCLAAASYKLADGTIAPIRNKQIILRTWPVPRLRLMLSRARGENQLEMQRALALNLALRPLRRCAITQSIRVAIGGCQ